MSSIVDAIHDDRIAWEDFCKRTGADTRWSLYSDEYYHAREIYKKYAYTDRHLRLAVRHAIERDELKKKQDQEFQELEHMITMLNKYT